MSKYFTSVSTLELYLEDMDQVVEKRNKMRIDNKCKRLGKDWHHGKRDHHQHNQCDDYKGVEGTPKRIKKVMSLSSFSEQDTEEYVDQLEEVDTCDQFLPIHIAITEIDDGINFIG